MYVTEQPGCVVLHAALLFSFINVSSLLQTNRNTLAQVTVTSALPSRLAHQNHTCVPYTFYLVHLYCSNETSATTRNVETSTEQAQHTSAAAI